jgi:hypothetical protein
MMGYFIYRFCLGPNTVKHPCGLAQKLARRRRSSGVGAKKGSNPAVLRDRLGHSYILEEMVKIISLQLLLLKIFPLFS